MDTSYAMAKFRLESKDMIKSKQKGCWHYMKYVFIFSSIIQFLIILGLVLFMLYGNAHGGTEHRLKTVESRYNNLILEHALLKSNFSSLKEKLAKEERSVKNFTDIIARMRPLTNRTCPIYSLPRTPLTSTNCNNLQAALDHLNMTCINERLKAENYRFSQILQSNQYRENCTKTLAEYGSRDRLLSSKNVQLENEKKELEAQKTSLRESCTDIDSKFKAEIEQLRNFYQAYLKPADQYISSSKCKLINDEINNRIDFTLTKLRQEVTAVASQNAQVQAKLDRTAEDLRTCNQVKDTVTVERNSLAADKASLQREMSVLKDELNKSYSRYIKKEEELESCRKPPIRSQGYIPTRT